MLPLIPVFFCYHSILLPGNYLSNTDIIFVVTISFSGDNLEAVLGSGVILKILKNC